MAKMSDGRMQGTSSAAGHGVRPRQNSPVVMVLQWALLLSLASLGAGCKLVPQAVGKEVECLCDCQLACSPDQVAFDVNGQAFCPSTVPGFGTTWPGPIPAGTDVVRACVGTGAVADSACAATCNGGTEHNFTVRNGGLTVIVFGSSGGLSKSKTCRYNGTKTFAQNATCSIPVGSSYVSDLTVAPWSNSIGAFTGPEYGSSPTILNEGESTVSVPAPRGTVNVSGICPNQSCSVWLELAHLEWTADGSGSTSYDAVTLVNKARIQGTMSTNGAIVFPAANLSFAAAVLEAGQRSNYDVAPTTDLTGTYDSASGQLNLGGTFSDGFGNQATLSAVALTDYRPPVANAGPNQNPSCRSSTVRLDGSASFDPDGDPVTFVWSENGKRLASTQVANVSLAAGVHKITLTAQDATNQWSQSGVTISVPSHSCH